MQAPEPHSPAAPDLAVLYIEYPRRKNLCYFNSTFLAAGTGYDNSAAHAIMGPGQFNFDMALIKDTKSWEGGTLQFRAEA
jgi:hypothetical protein